MDPVPIALLCAVLFSTYATERDCEKQQQHCDNVPTNERQQMLKAMFGARQTFYEELVTQLRRIDRSKLMEHLAAYFKLINAVKREAESFDSTEKLCATTVNDLHTAELCHVDTMGIAEERIHCLKKNAQMIQMELKMVGSQYPPRDMQSTCLKKHSPEIIPIKDTQYKELGPLEFSQCLEQLGLTNSFEEIRLRLAKANLPFILSQIVSLLDADKKFIQQRSDVASNEALKAEIQLYKKQQHLAETMNDWLDTNIHIIKLQSNLGQLFDAVEANLLWNKKNIDKPIAAISALIEDGKKDSSISWLYGIEVEVANEEDLEKPQGKEQIEVAGKIS